MADDEAVRAIVFGGMDAGTALFAGAGFKAAPERVDRQGFALLAVLGAGARLEPRAALASQVGGPLLRTTGAVGLLGGYQFFFDWGVLGLFAGPEGSVETLIGVSGFDAVETRFGARFHGELWARTSENTLTTVTLVTGSARWDAYARLAAGYRILGGYLGPEVTAYTDRTGYQKWSLGLHLTDFGFGFDAFRFRLSAGYSFEGETQRLAPYVSLSGWIPL